MEPSAKVLKAIRQKMEKGWSKETGYELYNSEPNSPIGQCFVSSLFAFIELKQFHPAIVSGVVEGFDEDHFWLEINNKILDFTADQFGTALFPKVVFAP
mgnify:FL=1